MDLARATGCDWDEGNARKNERHGVSVAEAEQVFFGTPLLILEDAAHSRNETRWHALGQTVAGRLLHLTFTLRRERTAIRAISARDMHRKEREIYGQES